MLFKWQNKIGNFYFTEETIIVISFGHDVKCTTETLLYQSSIFSWPLLVLDVIMVYTWVPVLITTRQ